MKDSRSKKTKVGKLSATMYHESTVFVVFSKSKKFAEHLKLLQIHNKACYIAYCAQYFVKVKVTLGGGRWNPHDLLDAGSKHCKMDYLYVVSQ